MGGYWGGERGQRSGSDGERLQIIRKPSAFRLSLGEKMLIGIVSEILLLAGILSVSFSVYLGFHCENTRCPLVLVQLERQLSYLAFALLVASAIGFLFVLKSSQRRFIPQGGAVRY